MDGKKLAIAIVIVCAILIVMTALYPLIMAALAEVNPVAAVATISVGVAGIAWFGKTSFHK
jgi:K+-transporting ATPase c subunit